MLKRKALFLVIIFSPFLLGGCSFFMPEDDLNGNNNEVKLEERILLEGESFAELQKNKEDNSLGQLEQLVGEHYQKVGTKTTPPKIETPPAEKEPTSEENDFLNYYNKFTKATIKTNYGKIKISFFNEDAKFATGNFIKLAENKFYDQTKFHRVISGFMIQGGDPNSKDKNWDDDGQGGPGYSFRDEINEHKLIRGALAMANSGKDTNGSQFFILTAESKPDLDGKHTVFGQVIEGMDTVDKIEKVRINNNDHPTQDVIIENIELEK